MIELQPGESKTVAFLLGQKGEGEAQALLRRYRDTAYTVDAELKELIGSRREASEKAIGKLPDNQQKVLRMRVFENMEYDEIASATGLSEGSLRVLLSAARKTLRKTLENERY